MTPELLRQVGEALYGPEWRMALARDLGVNYHTMRRWQGGTAPIPAGVAGDLLEMVGNQLEALERVQRALRREEVNYG